MLVAVLSEDDTVFLNCLEKQPTTYPTSETSYTKHNSSFQSVFNELVRNRRFLNPVFQKPLVIVTAKDASDVQATLFCCKKHNVQLRVRGGGHDMEGTSYIAGAGVPFVILDMLNMRSIKINIEEEIASIQAGAVLGEVYYALAQKSRVHAFPGGVCPTVGVTGHFSGGGYGNLMREYGLSTDHVVDAVLVDVDGKVLNRTSMGEDRFWAIRGGGAASFGIVLAWKVMLVRVPPLVTVFRVTRTLEQGAPETMYRWQEIAPNLPKKIFIRVRVTVLPKAELKFSFIGLFLGSTQELVELLDEKFPELGLSTKDCNEMPWVNSTLFWADAPVETPTQFLISRQDEKVSRKVKSDFVVEPIPKQGIEKICKTMLNMQGLVMEWNPYGGRMSEIPGNEIAYPHRAGILFKIEYDFKWYETGIDVDKYHVELSRSFYKFMTPYVSKSPRMAYFNYRDFDIGINHGNKQDTNITTSFGMNYYGNNFIRLMKVKTETDPANFFRYEQSIPPTTSLS
ncbi:berberine bridge enzyme-like 7 [Silene latifolia]|uniref:berberine bridge enzyme-like 7 n=1 Tax=Silene latifolia TaxID=37657 RepID=UPI003D7728AC